MKVEHSLQTDESREIYRFVCKMMVRWNLNADYGQEKQKKCCLVRKMVVQLKSNTVYGWKEVKKCITVSVK